MPKRESIGLEGLSNEQINEGFTPKASETMSMTEGILDDAYAETERTNYRKPRRGKSETGLFEEIDPIPDEKIFSTEKAQPAYEAEIKPAAMPEITIDTVNGKSQSETVDDWNRTHPIDLENLNKGLKEHEETDDKSFLMETSAVRIINEEDIEEYYRNKK